MKKKALAFVTLTSLLIPSLSFAAEPVFNDVGNNPAAPFITYLQEKGVVKGVGNGLFMPDQPIELQHLNLLLGKVSGKQVNMTMSHRVAVYKTIVSLFNFDPAKNLTNEQINNLLNDYKDKTDIPDGDRQAVAFLVQQGILDPIKDNQLRPHQPITRAEVATVIAKLAQKNMITLPSETSAPETSMTEDSMNSPMMQMHEKALNMMQKMMSNNEQNIQKMQQMANMMTDEQQKNEMLQMISNEKMNMQEMMNMMGTMPQSSDNVGANTPTTESPVDQHNHN